MKIIIYSFLFTILICFTAKNFSASCASNVKTPPSPVARNATTHNLNDLEDLKHLSQLKNLKQSGAQEEGLCSECKKYCYACQYCVPVTGDCSTICQQPNPPAACSKCFNCAECDNCASWGACGKICVDMPPYCPPPGRATKTCYTPAPL